MKELVAYVYKTTNLINGLIYIGKVYRIKDNKSYFGSGTKIVKALKEFGKHNFNKEILEICDSKEKLDKRESFWISFFNSTNESIGYNICKINNATTGSQWLDENHRHQVSLNISKSHSKRTIKQKSFSTIKRLKTINGKSDEEKEVIRKRMRDSHLGKEPGNKGKPSSKNKKEKISKALMGNKNALGWKPSKDLKIRWSAMRKGRNK